ncbi:hypothetical protein NH286_05130 [Anaerococcus sp. NML200574]|uniref:hypothetical protein n=1 Tax=unclassified Anaerococcus TaxID=2614126 RepID=UPI002236F067|nr:MULTISPECIES: hypothetical protein [unclassified Anaerococcus]MCW6678537.1 hypothetical protein [Anaerococcus sp. NML200574]MCW6701768.1 hypothetical protein [Anaerococcus sp. NML200537]
MAERIEYKIIKNNNKGRVRLKVKEKPKRSKSYNIDLLRKRDRMMKFWISLFVFSMLMAMTTFLINKRINLSNERFEYNRLQADIVSYELQRDRLKTSLDEAVDLNRIQRYAIEDLDMVYQDNN